MLSIRFRPQLGRKLIVPMNDPIQVAELACTGRLSMRVLNTESFGVTMQPAREF